MSRNRRKVSLLARVERPALVPGVFDRGDGPEVALGILHDPLLTRPISENGCHLLRQGPHALLRSRLVQGIRPANYDSADVPVSTGLSNAPAAIASRPQPSAITAITSV